MKLLNRMVYNEIRLHLSGLLFILLLILLGVTFETLAPWPFKLLIDNVLGNERPDRTTFLGQFLNLFTSREALGFFVVFAFAALSLLSSLTEYFVSITTKNLSRDLVFNFSRKSFENMEKLSVGYYRKQEIGDYIYRLSYDVSALGDFLESGAIPLIINSLYLVATVTVLFLIKPEMALLSLLILPVLAFSLYVFNRWIGLESKKSEFSNSALFSFIEEVLGQLKVVQAFNQEARETETFKIKEKTSLVDELNVYGLGFLLNLFIGLIIAIGYAVIIIYGIKAVFQGEMTTGILVVFIFYLDNLTNPLLSFISAAASLKENFVRISRLGDFFRSKYQTRDKGRRLNPKSSEIIFNKVSLQGDEKHSILKGISFKIFDGKKTAIVGVNGSGKTTIASLILRFLEPSSGQITIGGENIKDISLKNLRQNISYVPQEVVLFNGSILNNILLGNPKATAAQVREAVALSGADKFIERLPRDYHFLVGEAGNNLSGGQRQRIMLARALLKTEAKILILDEPLSSLDIKNRELVMNNLNRFAQGKTTIVISNILEIIKNVDQVIVLNEGRLTHVGSSESLLRESHVSSLIINSS